MEKYGKFIQLDLNKEDEINKIINDPNKKYEKLDQSNGKQGLTVEHVKILNAHYSNNQHPTLYVYPANSITAAKFPKERINLNSVGLAAIFEIEGINNYGIPTCKQPGGGEATSKEEIKHYIAGLYFEIAKGKNICIPSYGNNYAFGGGVIMLPDEIKIFINDELNKLKNFMGILNKAEFLKDEEIEKFALGMLDGQYQNAFNAGKELNNKEWYGPYQDINLQENMILSEPLNFLGQKTIKIINQQSEQLKDDHVMDIDFTNDSTQLILNQLNQKLLFIPLSKKGKIELNDGDILKSTYKMLSEKSEYWQRVKTSVSEKLEKVNKQYDCELDVDINGKLTRSKFNFRSKKKQDRHATPIKVITRVFQGIVQNGMTIADLTQVLLNQLETFKTGITRNLHSIQISTYVDNYLDNLEQYSKNELVSIQDAISQIIPSLNHYWGLKLSQELFAEILNNEVPLETAKMLIQNKLKKFIPQYTDEEQKLATEIQDIFTYYTHPDIINDSQEVKKLIKLLASLYNQRNYLITNDINVNIPYTTSDCYLAMDEKFRTKKYYYGVTTREVTKQGVTTTKTKKSAEGTFIEAQDEFINNIHNELYRDLQKSDIPITSQRLNQVIYAIYSMLDFLPLPDKSTSNNINLDIKNRYPNEPIERLYEIAANHLQFIFAAYPLLREQYGQQITEGFIRYLTYGVTETNLNDLGLDLDKLTKELTQAKKELNNFTSQGNARGFYQQYKNESVLNLIGKKELKYQNEETFYNAMLTNVKTILAQRDPSYFNNPSQSTQQKINLVPKKPKALIVHIASILCRYYLYGDIDGNFEKLPPDVKEALQLDMNNFNIQFQAKLKGKLPKRFDEILNESSEEQKDKLFQPDIIYKAIKETLQENQQYKLPPEGSIIKLYKQAPKKLRVTKSWFTSIHEIAEKPPEPRISGNPGNSNFYNTLALGIAELAKFKQISNEKGIRKKFYNFLKNKLSLNKSTQKALLKWLKTKTKEEIQTTLAPVLKDIIRVEIIENKNYYLAELQTIFQVITSGNFPYNGPLVNIYLYMKNKWSNLLNENNNDNQASREKFYDWWMQYFQNNQGIETLLEDCSKAGIMDLELLALSSVLKVNFECNNSITQQKHSFNIGNRLIQYDSNKLEEQARFNKLSNMQIGYDCYGCFRLNDNEILHQQFQFENEDTKFLVDFLNKTFLPNYLANKPMSLLKHDKKNYIIISRLIKKEILEYHSSNNTKEQHYSLSKSFLNTLILYLGKNINICFPVNETVFNNAINLFNQALEYFTNNNQMFTFSLPENCGQELLQRGLISLSPPNNDKNTYAFTIGSSHELQAYLRGYPFEPASQEVCNALYSFFNKGDLKSAFPSNETSFEIIVELLRRNIIQPGTDGNYYLTTDDQEKLYALLRGHSDLIQFTDDFINSIVNYYQSQPPKLSLENKDNQWWYVRAPEKLKKLQIDYPEENIIEREKVNITKPSLKRKGEHDTPVRKKRKLNNDDQVSQKTKDPEIKLPDNTEKIDIKKSNELENNSTENKIKPPSFGMKNNN